MTPPFFSWEETDFNRAWERILKLCITRGEPITFGGPTEKKRALDTCQVISLTGAALDQMKRGEVHRGCPFKNVKQYAEEYTREYLKKYKGKPDKEKFVYLYFERLTEYLTFWEEDEGWSPVIEDQLLTMCNSIKHQLETKTLSNRCQAITWDVSMDETSGTPPCLQRIWARPSLQGLDVHLSWRSRDAYGAWQANLVAIVQMLYREILEANELVMARLVDMNDSLHVYVHDSGAAEHTANNGKGVKNGWK